MACKPSDYFGNEGATGTIRWLEEMEEILDISNCLEEDKVRFATHSLKDGALAWWNMLLQTRVRNANTHMTWEEFKKLMIEKYCPANEMDKMESEFLKLEMKGTAHMEYTNRFNELSRLVPHLVTRESKRIGRTNVCYKGNRSDHVATDYKARSKAPPRCHSCGSADHMRPECPKLKETRATVGRPKGRAFVMNAEEAIEEPDVVTGTFLINNHYAFVLFDTGASKSFVSTNSRPRIELDSSKLSNAYIIELANGKTMEAHEIINNCTLELDDHPFPINLMLLQLGGFDVVVGMDWLAQNIAETVCDKRLLRIPLPDEKVLTIHGEISKETSNIISCIKANKFV
ncbi:uncharacterized protein LOC143606879 [Bidens hawaiensis]|uniref:uncharacterized protein LOC143606879 n=1 Tax=Bidens hawaiensis TaxID=980011 RepID=UPI004049CCDA